MLSAAQRFAATAIVYCTATVVLQIGATEINLTIARDEKPNPRTQRIKVMRNRCKATFFPEAFKTGQNVLHPK